MTADPIRTHINHHSPATRFAGQVPAVPKPIAAATLAAPPAHNSPSDVNLPDPNAAAALIRRETAPSKAPPAARNIANSP